MQSNHTVIPQFPYTPSLLFLGILLGYASEWMADIDLSVSRFTLIDPVVLNSSIEINPHSLSDSYDFRYHSQY